jgi:hypothetical protein
MSGNKIPLIENIDNPIDSAFLEKAIEKYFNIQNRTVEEEYQD